MATASEKHLLQINCHGLPEKPEVLVKQDVTATIEWREGQAEDPTELVAVFNRLIDFHKAKGTI